MILIQFLFYADRRVLPEPITESLYGTHHEMTDYEVYLFIARSANVIRVSAVALWVSYSKFLHFPSFTVFVFPTSQLFSLISVFFQRYWYIPGLIVYLVGFYAAQRKQKVAALVVGLHSNLSFLYWIVSGLEWSKCVFSRN